MEQFFAVAIVLGILTFPFWGFRTPNDTKDAYVLYLEIKELRAQGKPIPASQDSWLATRDPRGS